MASQDLQSSAARCPFHNGRGVVTTVQVDPTGRAISADAAAFDPFEGPYQVDPADAMRWSRAQEPIFFSPKIGYWIVSRYEDVKAAFRDNVTTSPSIALEKMTRNWPEAN